MLLQIIASLNFVIEVLNKNGVKNKYPFEDYRRKITQYQEDTSRPIPNILAIVQDVNKRIADFQEDGAKQPIISISVTITSCAAVCLDSGKVMIE